MRGQLQVLSILFILFLVLQLAGLIMIVLGFFDPWSYLVGWLTGIFLGIILMLLFVLVYLKQEGKRIVEAIISKIL